MSNPSRKDFLQARPKVFTGFGVIEDIQVRKGGILRIILESNPTTGYSWEASFDQGYLSLEDHEFSRDSDLIGAGGWETFTFRSLSEGKTVIVMRYRRPWEEGEVQTVRYSIRSE